MYQALYRKWRPKVFEDVVGQEHITQTLKNEVKNGKIGHAYLFTGLRGTGKTTCAKILSRAVNCLHPVDGDPCNECDNCKGISSGSILDVSEIDAASNSGVDNIRDIRDEAVYTPTNALKRVYIIDEAHMLSTGAWNALLKILEEPPSHVVFILATTESQKIPATILSRCQRFDFRRIPLPIISERLRMIAQNEGVTCEDDALRTIARLADGSMRDSLSLLDQCIGVTDHIALADVISVTGMVSSDYLSQISFSVGNRDFERALSILSSLYENAKNFTLLCDELITHYRNLLLVRTLRSPAAFLSVGEEEIALLQKSAALYTKERLLYCIDVLSGALEIMYRNSNKRVQLEMSILRMCDESGDTGLSGVLARLSALEAGYVPQKAGAKTAPSPTSPMAQNTQDIAPPSDAPKPPSQNGVKIAKTGLAPGVDVNDLPFDADLSGLTPPPEGEYDSVPQDFVPSQPSVSNSAPVSPGENAQSVSGAGSPSANTAKLEEVISLLRKAKKRAVAAHLSGAKMHVEGNKVVITVDNDMAQTILEMSDGEKALENAIREVFGSEYTHSVQNGAGVTEKSPALTDAFKQLLETSDQFEGIVEITEE